MADVTASKGASKGVSLLQRYSPDQPRDPQGEWTDGGGSGSGSPKLVKPEIIQATNHGRDYSVYVNPNARQVAGLFTKSEFRDVRGLAKENDIALGDAGAATHDDIWSGLKNSGHPLNEATLAFQILRSDATDLGATKTPYRLKGVQDKFSYGIIDSDTGDALPRNSWPAALDQIFVPTGKGVKLLPQCTLDEINRRVAS